MPLPSVLEFLRRKFNDNKVQLPPGLTIDALINLIKLCCESTVFSFNDSFYQQIEGVAMGSPLACILANLFMEYFETQLRHQCPHQPIIWWRYVDDIICIWPHGMERFQSFLDGLNQLVPSINFTTEWEVYDGDSGIATLPFLDVLIHRSLTGVTFSIYRKSSHCHMYIHYFSNHPPHVKKGTLSGLFLRALRISSDVHLQSELDILWTAFTQLGYPIFFIRDALSTAKTKFYASPPLNISVSSSSSETPISKHSVIPVPYTDLNDPPKKHLKRTKYKLASTSRNSIGRAVVQKRGKTKGSSHQLNGVYMIPLIPLDPTTGNNLPYIGRTNTTLENRLSQHRNSIRKNYEACAMVKHIRNNPGDKYDLENARIIWRTNDIIESKMVESAFIQTLPCCNTHPGEIAMSPIMASVITKITNPKISDPVDRRRPQVTTSLYTPTVYIPPTPPAITLPSPSPTTTPSQLLPSNTNTSPQHLSVSQPSTSSVQKPIPYMRRLASSQPGAQPSPMRLRSKPPIRRNPI